MTSVVDAIEALVNELTQLRDEVFDSEDDVTDPDVFDRWDSRIKWVRDEMTRLLALRGASQFATEFMLTDMGIKDRVDALESILGTKKMIARVLTVTRVTN